MSDKEVKDQVKEVPTTGETPETKDTPEKAPTTGNKYGDDEDEESKVVLENQEKAKSDEDVEDLIYIQRAKVYRFRDGKWKQRGEGQVKFLRSKDNKIRFVQR